MLIQCDYQVGNFLLKGGNIYYKGNKISHAQHTAVMSAGTDELFLLAGGYPLPCPWLVIVQSRFPIFYECKKVEFVGEKVMLYFADGKQMRVKPYRDGTHDRLLIDQIYAV